ncbi:NUP82 [Candida pseudojiufengensis]|uniref:NUP82 n=1 Tax=Candida pseudojiufengensis TaxID=497109 RepID=UPI002224FF53|nr:NUP82 [Candida pseudojiufengensis]KAI5963238.1 NUP82 [Candida pseudojiufengensis]
MSDVLISSISIQSIFQHRSSIESSHFFSPNLFVPTSQIVEPNKLILRNDSEIFFAIDNLVRCCIINPITTNYKLLKTLQPNFEILSLELNESGNYLALIGESKVEIIVLPPRLNTKQKSIHVENTRNYKIVLQKGKIKKMIWQPIIASDSMLVILTDQNEIFGYDLKKSTTIPTIKIQAKENLNSITFGSRSKISEGLKLYAATDETILRYDFFTETTTIAVSENALDVAIEDSKLIIELIEEEFEDQPNSSLLRQAQDQLSYYKLLQLNELSKNFREVRSVYSQNPIELFTIRMKNLVPKHEPEIVASIGADDIISFGDNEQISLIATIQNNTISYFTKVLDTNFIKIKKVPDHYQKPKRGFGFVEVQDDINVEFDFYKKNLSDLDFIQSEILPVEGSGYLKAVNHRDDKFVAVIDSNLLTINCEWVNDLVVDLINNNKDCLSTINPIYDLISKGKDLQGFAFISQFDKEVAIVVRDSLEIVDINKDEEVHHESTNKGELLIEDKPHAPSLNLTEGQPFAEIETNLKNLKNSILKRPQGDLSPSVENLAKINEISIKTNKVITNCSVYAIKLQSRMILQLRSLTLQAETLKSLSTAEKPYNEKTSKRISDIKLKQDKLQVKLKNIQNKINDEFFKIKDIPFSNDEKKYFDEINKCNTLSFELVKKLDDYRSQLDELKKEKHEKKKKEAADIEGEEASTLNDLRTYQKVKKLKNWLNHQDSEIHELMDKVKIY